MGQLESILPIDSDHFRKIMGLWPTGVSIVTGFSNEGQPVGMAVSSFCSVSLEPPLVSFCPQKTATTWNTIKRGGKFCVNILGADQQDLCKQFATGNPLERFNTIEFSESPFGLPQLPECVAWIDVETLAEYEGGDHWIVVGTVKNLIQGVEAEPMIFAQGKMSKLAG